MISSASLSIVIIEIQPKKKKNVDRRCTPLSWVLMGLGSPSMIVEEKKKKKKKKVSGSRQGRSSQMSRKMPRDLADFWKLGTPN